jgi:hypothetical protein
VSREPKSAGWFGRCPLDLDVDETRLLEPLGQLARINGHAYIAGVQLAPFRPVDAVDADEQSARAEHAP